jgi:trehalose 6-phosphate phosphatase
MVRGSGYCLLLDFDGTLAEIVDDPQTAKVVAEGIPVLQRLSMVLGMVGIVSGRPLEFLEERFPEELFPSLWIAGSYGAETLRRGCESSREGASMANRERFEVMKEELAPLARFGVGVEVKPVSVTLHFRRHPEAEPYVRAEVRRLERTFGVFAIEAKCAIEVFPSVPPSKGSVVRLWGGAWREVTYLGDDLSDLEAFDALSELEGRGVSVQRIAVVPHGTESILQERSDLTLDGPRGVVQWLMSLEREHAEERER